MTAVKVTVERNSKAVHGEQLLTVVQGNRTVFIHYTFGASITDTFAEKLEGMLKALGHEVTRETKEMPTGGA